MFYEGRRRERERERERVVVVVKVVVECALVLKKKKEDDCDEINCRLVFFLHSVLLLGNCESSQKGQKEGGFYMIKGSTFVRSLQTNNV